MSVQQTGSLEAALARIMSLQGLEVTLGVHGTGETTAEGELAPNELVRIAGWLQFGTRHQPARPFLTVPLRIRGDLWSRGMVEAARLMLRGQEKAAGVTIRQVGVKGVSDIQEFMRHYGWAPNAPLTIARKAETEGTARPTIDSGQLRQSIRAAVEVPGRAPEVIG